VCVMVPVAVVFDGVVLMDTKRFVMTMSGWHCTGLPFDETSHSLSLGLGEGARL
jgi:hypothetical protein